MRSCAFEAAFSKASAQRSLLLYNAVVTEPKRHHRRARQGGQIDEKTRTEGALRVG